MEDSFKPDLNPARAKIPSEKAPPEPYRGASCHSVLKDLEAAGKGRLAKRLAAALERAKRNPPPEPEHKPPPNPPRRVAQGLPYAKQHGSPAARQIRLNPQQKKELEAKAASLKRRKKKRAPPKEKVFIPRGEVDKIIKKLSSHTKGKLEKLGKAGWLWLDKQSADPENQTLRPHTTAFCVSDWRAVCKKLKLNRNKCTEALRAFLIISRLALAKSKFYRAKAPRLNELIGFGMNNSYAHSRKKTKALALLKKIISALKDLSWIDIAPFTKICWRLRTLLFRSQNLWTAMPARAPPQTP